ncbi:MAG: translation elongation factor Ts [Planctomycetaceae bacterium]|nr:translation elongation factor Ts [Planctomycetaceae bacterium]
MAEISAAAVKSLRERTGLPMMDCKKALQEAQGSVDKAVELLRKGGAKLMEKRAGRATTSGRIAVYVSPRGTSGTMIDLRCESAPVAANQEFTQLANDLAQQLAEGPGAATPDELLAQPSPSGSPTLKQQFDDLMNRIREVFRLERIVRIDGQTGGYAHHNAAAGVLLQYEGDNPEVARDICMHVAALRPTVTTRKELDPTEVEKEREILAAAARKEGKPENIIAKMVEGRLRDFYAARCLEDQPIANEMKFGKKTVGEIAKESKIELVRFVHWELPRE